MLGYLEEPPAEDPCCDDGDGPSVDVLKVTTAGSAPGEGQPAYNISDEDHRRLDRAAQDLLKRASAGEGATAAAAGGRFVLATATLKCHRASKEKPGYTQEGKVQVRSKKDADCPFTIKLVVYADEPDFVYITEHNGHMGHEPGSAEDTTWLPMEA